MLMPVNDYSQAQNLFGQDVYYSPHSKKQVNFPSACFYSQAARVVIKAGCIAAKHLSSYQWVDASFNIAKAVENVGGRLEVTGMNAWRNLKGSCIFVGNHMSTLETFVLPSLIQPWKDVTFVVKSSLLQYPFFGAVLKSRDPIKVGRTNPREDLTSVLEGGFSRLSAGRSLIIFPQSTRSNDFDLAKFNTIAIKLAKKAEVPLVPIALKTDFWSNGKLFKDFGYIHPKRTVHINFGEPVYLSGNGKDEHAKICEFISSNLDKWRN